MTAEVHPVRVAPTVVPTRLDVALHLMDGNAFCPRVARAALGAQLMSDACFPHDVPFAFETLKECWETHMLFPDPGCSVVSLEAAFPSLVQPVRAYRDLKFMRRTERPAWRLMRVQPADGSYGLTTAEQFALIDHAKEEVPYLRRIAVFACLHILRTGEWPFRERRIYRVRDQLPHARPKQVTVGPFQRNGFVISTPGMASQNHCLGVAVERKPDVLTP